MAVFTGIGLALGASAATAAATGVAVTGLAATAAAGAMKADAQYKAGRQQKRQALTEADMVEIATQQADIEARENIRRTRVEQRSFTGAQRAAVASSGVVGTTGSPMDILGRTAALQELQIQDQARQASAEYSAGFAKAKQIRVAGKSALKGAKRASVGTLISTAASVATSAYGAYDTGALKFGSQRSLVPAS